ncbi:MAG: DinB family protein [Candidatus Thorarchaeota archaeon]|nr:DinB family protein [Candidatus Thorarchaeota archaeon]
MTSDLLGVTKASIANQFAASWKMLRAAIDLVPEEKWHGGMGKWYYSYTVYHIIETAQFYMRNEPGDMKWGARAGYEWHESIDIKTEILPMITKQLVRSFLDEIQSSLDDIMGAITDNAISTQDGFYWFRSVHDKLLYLLRHTAHHLGELARTLREWKLDPVKWT